MNYLKTLLIFSFSFIETYGTKFFNWNLKGYANNEMNNLSKYEPYLVEISEQSYMQWSSKLPPELKLGCVLMFSVVQYQVPLK